MTMSLTSLNIMTKKTKA